MNTQFKCAIFDLDGTLVNTIDDLGLATDYVLEQYGRTPKWTQADYKKLVGNGAKKTGRSVLLSTSSHRNSWKKLTLCLR